ncbi:unnamed protein product [Spirodela intermedia]|uniref:Uncharacterized protein n=1 Tax=Spirodela intermedia TaxID=51605 RepID=A0A7I8JRT3_SPIIN|nr:unnamed protein product [Spirodela intermedia]CAA6672273.1 unnamed protein product [Spirodela intermedia]
MEPDVSMETGSMIRVAVLPVGGPVPRTSSGLCIHAGATQQVALSSISSFYMEHQKSPFTNQPWETGSLRFKFMVGGSPPAPGRTSSRIGRSWPSLASATAPRRRIWASYRSSSQPPARLEDKFNKDRRIILFPPSDRKTQEFHMLTMVQDLAASLLMEFEKWVLSAESAGTILKTPLDSQASLSSEEFIKAKKKRLGRAQKTIGDYCLLAGSPLDANAHYTTAIELARLTGDVFWHAGALEGSVFALLVGTLFKIDPALEEEVKYRYFTVIQLYRRSFLPDNSRRISTVSFELEATLRLARFLCRHELAKEVVDLLMGAVARLFGTLGYHRKAAFFSRQVAQLYLQQDSAYAAISAMKVLSLTSKAYHIQSKRGDSNSESKSTHAEGGKVHLQSIVSLFESQWSTLQMVVLREILMSSVRAGDPLAAWSAAARLLRFYYPSSRPPARAASRAPSPTQPSDSRKEPAAPTLRSLLSGTPSAPSIYLSIYLYGHREADTWEGGLVAGLCPFRALHLHPFQQVPFHRGAAKHHNHHPPELTWVVGEPVHILVELANPCGFDLTVDSLPLRPLRQLRRLPVSLRLPPTSAKVVPLSGIPTGVGPVSIPGCVVHCFGVVTEHLFKDVDNLLQGAAQGLVKLAAPPAITAAPPLPLLVAHVVGGDGAAILYEGEVRDISLRLTNAGTVPVEQAHLSFSGKNQDAVSAPPPPGAEVSLQVTVKAWQLSPADRRSKQGASPLLVIYYAGPVAAAPGRRLAVPLQVSVSRGYPRAGQRTLPAAPPAGEEDGRRGGRLVKINPYRGSWGLRLLELELSNPTDEGFEVNVVVLPEGGAAAATDCSTTRIDRDYSARVLIPLEHFKLPVIDGSFLGKTERSAKAEVDACIDSLISKIKVRWRSGRSSRGELSIKEAAQAALQSSVMDVLLPDPLTFGFRLRRTGGAAIAASEMVPLEILVRNNTKELIKMDLTISCRDVAGNNCVDGDNATVLWADNRPVKHGMKNSITIQADHTIYIILLLV